MVEINISGAISETLPLLNDTGIDYWLGRGVLRNLYIRGTIGRSNSDLDFHVWEEDSAKVKNKLFPFFGSIHSNLCVDERNYKLAFYTPEKNKRHDFFVEFMFLFRDSGGDFVYHERLEDGKKYANAECFSPNRLLYIQHNSQLIRVPALVDEYLLGTYGPRWRENIRDDKHFNSTPEFLLKHKEAHQALTGDILG